MSSMGCTGCIVLLVCLLSTFRSEYNHVENQSISTSKNISRGATIIRHRFLKSRVLYYSHGAASFQPSLLLSGDIELNPGPRASEVDHDEFPEIKRPRFEGDEQVEQTVDWSKCLFCGSLKKCGTKKMQDIKTHQFIYTLSKTASNIGDEEMLGKIHLLSRNDLIGVARYHTKCYKMYMYRAKQNQNDASQSCHFRYHENDQSKAFESDHRAETLTDVSNESGYEKAFVSLIQEIDIQLAQGDICDMKCVLGSYNIKLLENGIPDPNYPMFRLKKRISDYYGNKVIFISRGSKSDLICGKMAADNHLVDRFASKSDNIDSATDSSLKEEPSDKGEDRDSILFKAACILKADICEARGIAIASISSDTITNTMAEEIVPKSLYRFLKWTVGNKSESNDGECQSVSKHRQVLSLGQDIMHCSSSKLKTPKHVGVGMEVWHKTGKKNIIQHLNQMGNSISYQVVKSIDNELGRKAKSLYQERGVFIPSNVKEGYFTQVAIDNFDLNEETLDGNHTTHATNIVLYQDQNDNCKIPVLCQRNCLQNKENSKGGIKLGLYDMKKVVLPGKKPTVSGYELVNDSWFDSRHVGEEHLLDFVWTFLRNPLPLETNDQQIPDWCSFNVAMGLGTPECNTTIGYCPMLNAPSTNYSTIYTVLLTVQNMMSCIGQKHSVITMDMAIYSKAKELLIRRSNEFPNTILRLGGMHIVMNYLGVIGKVFEESGLEDILVESGVYASATASSLLKGRMYNRGIRAHKLLLEAMLRLRWHAFLDWVNSQPNMTKRIDDICKEQGKLHKAYVTCCKSFGKDNKVVHTAVHSLSQNLQSLMYFFHKFENAAKESKMFQFWNLYIDMITILLNFTRAEREGNWELHLNTSAAMLPFFFAADRPNYSRFLTTYIADMNMLPTTAPEVNSFLNAGLHVVHRSMNAFSGIETDKALEQTINRDSKTSGGIIGKSLKPNALENWYLTYHERAAIVTSFRGMCESHDLIKYSSGNSKSRQKRDQDDVQKIEETITNIMVNPFILKSGQNSDIPLSNIATGMSMDDDSAKKLINIQMNGKIQMRTFIDKRLKEKSVDFFKPISKLNIPTFATANKFKDRAKINQNFIQADKKFFSRCMIASKHRNLNLEDMFKYEFSNIPLSLFYSDGTYRKTDKSALLQEIQSIDTGHDLIYDKLPTNLSNKSAYIIDAMEMIQKLDKKMASFPTFGSFALGIFTSVVSYYTTFNCSRVDMVFDRYDIPMSIKEHERIRRANGITGIDFVINSGSTPIPKQWDKFMARSGNKHRLTQFLASELIKLAKNCMPKDKQLLITHGENVTQVSNGTSNLIHDLFSNHEEADTRIILHANHASHCEGHENIIVRSPDTDVALLLLYFADNFKSNIWFHTGTVEKERIVHINPLSTQIPTDILLGFHALTGADCTSAFTGKGKTLPWRQVLKNKARYERGLQSLGEKHTLLPQGFECIKLVQDIYAGGECDININALRYKIFCQKQCDSPALPPTSDSLIQHLQRANYQTFLWKQSLIPQMKIPSPVQHGWCLLDNMLTPIFITSPPIPESVLELTACKCVKSDCTRKTCVCKKNNLPCIDSCRCFNGDRCQNPIKQEPEEVDLNAEDSEEDEFYE